MFFTLDIPVVGREFLGICPADDTHLILEPFSTDTIHVHSSTRRRYWLAVLSIWILKNRHHKRRWPQETGTRRRVILDLLLNLNYLQKKPSTPLSRKFSATSGITHHQIFPTNQQKVSSHHQSVQSLLNGERTIPPPLASTRADMPCPSAGDSAHLQSCQHSLPTSLLRSPRGSHKSLYKGTQPLINHHYTNINQIPPFLSPPPHIQGPHWGTHQVTQQKGYSKPGLFG